MKYSLGDKFVIRGVLCQVGYTNVGKAWLFPIDDIESTGGQVTAHSFVSFEVLDEKGRDRQGNKALVVNNVECGAV
jgi:hypothetical protein